MTIEIVFNDKTSFSIGDQRVAHFKAPHTWVGIEGGPRSQSGILHLSQKLISLIQNNQFIYQSFFQKIKLTNKEVVTVATENNFHYMIIC